MHRLNHPEGGASRNGQKVSTRRADFEEVSSQAAQGGLLELVAEYEPDEKNEARILLMILGLPPAEIEDIIEEMSLVSSGEM